MLANRILERPLAVRRTVALVALVLLVPALWGGIILPVRWIATSQQDWREEAGTQLARDRGHANLLPSVRAQLEALPKAEVWSHFYPDGAEGGASVQRDITALCSSAGLIVQSATQLPSENTGSLLKYPMRLVASGNAEQLTAFVTAFHRHARYLRAERLNVSAPQSQRPDLNAIVTITVDVAGYAIPDRRPRHTGSGA